MELELDDGKFLVKLARKHIEDYFKGLNESIKDESIKEIPKKFNEKCGVFVTLETYPENNLRGCIGYPEPVMPLKDALFESALSAAFRDPRFPPVTKEEFENVIVEVTVLTKPEIIKATNPLEYLNQIKIGRDGLIAERGFLRGLLLPQVPVEMRWNVEEFLSETCCKAGLTPDAWLDKKTKIYKFEGRIFCETSPKGEIIEKKINKIKCVE